MKKLLILNGSFCEEPLIKTAKQMGFYVFTTGNMPELCGHKFADKYINADYSNKEAILQIVKSENIDHIVSCANDFGALTASYVAEKMGWDGHDTFANAKTLHHKELFKKFCYENSIPSPHSTSFSNLQNAIDFAKNQDFPIIVKPNDLTGGKGISRADNPSQAKTAVENAFAISRDKVVVIEPFIEGTQHTFVGFLINKKVYCCTGCNCYSVVNPYLIQSETFPADDFDHDKIILTEIEERIAQKLNLADGIFALQYLKKDGHIYVIETMRRPFGNQFLTLCSLTTGFNWEKAQILAQTGQNPTLPISTPKMKYCGHHGIMARRNGTLVSYSIDNDFEKHLFNKIVMKNPGDEITNYLNERIAYLYYQYDNIDEMNRDAKVFNDKIKIELV